MNPNGNARDPQDPPKPMRIASETVPRPPPGATTGQSGPQVTQRHGQRAPKDELGGTKDAQRSPEKHEKADQGTP